jgi:hypothetical protein
MERPVRPDVLVKVQIPSGELLLSPSIDVVHRFSFFGAHILKYWNQETATMNNIMLKDEGVEFLVNECGLYVVDRPFMTFKEHEAHVAFAADTLDESEFGLD